MQAVVDFIVAHKAILAGVIVAILDLIFALSPALAGNGILHQLYLLLAGPKAPASLK